MHPVKLSCGRYVIAIPMLDGSTQFSAYVFRTERDADAFLCSGGSAILLELHPGAL